MFSSSQNGGFITVLKLLFIFANVNVSRFEVFGQLHNITVPVNIDHVTLTTPGINHTIHIELYFPSNTTNAFDKNSNQLNINSVESSNKMILFMFGHGFTGNVTWYDYVFTYLVPQNVVVAMINSLTDGPAFAYSVDFRISLDYIYSQSKTNESFILFNKLIYKSIVSGHSMGGGTAILASNNDNYNFNDFEFEYSFDGLFSLCGCGGRNVYQSIVTQTRNIDALLMGASEDCDCPNDIFIDRYWTQLNDNLNVTCKYKLVVNNACHCGFLNSTQEINDACFENEESNCLFNKTMHNLITFDQQCQIAAKYMILFSHYVAIDDNDNDNIIAKYKAKQRLADQIQTDLNNSVLYSADYSCFSDS